MQDLELSYHATEEIRRIEYGKGIKVFWEEKRSIGSAPSARAGTNLNFVSDN